MISVVFVCTGNICRSPMGEGILRKLWDTSRNGALRVSSMGVQGLDTAPAASLAVQVCAAHGVDISAHRSRSLSYRELDTADLIFCMEAHHKDFIDLYHGSVSDATVLLGAWPEMPGRNSGIDDPYGGSLRIYEKCYDTIAMHLERVIPHMVEAFWPRIKAAQ